MRKLIYIFLVTAILPSCINVGNIEVKSANIAKFNSLSSNSASFNVDVVFDSDRDISFVVKSLEGNIYVKDKEVCGLRLNEKTKVYTSPDSVNNFSCTLDFDGGILGAALIVSRLQKNIDLLTVSGELVLKKGLISRKFKINNMTIKELEKLYK